MIAVKKNISNGSLTNIVDKEMENYTILPDAISTISQRLTEKYENTLEKMRAITAPVQNTTVISPTRVCEKISENKLYQKLEKVGGRNQQFMANSPEEAGRNFADLIPHHDELYALNSNISFDGILDEQPEDDCDSSCTEITQRLRDWIKDEESDYYADYEKKFYDHGPAEVQEGKPGSFKVSCSLEQFIPVTNCTPRGEEEIWGHGKLCTACHGVYTLSKDCFPRFVNSVTCGSDDDRCIFDKMPKAHGKCQLRTLSFKVLRNQGTPKCEQWMYEYIDVPIACECYLDKSSPSLSATPSQTGNSFF
ncbi:unnamed protein product [Enterobius vermicularis]|uniref:Protein spaetzle n=1 Tax=Enterobius vermicularis TaxID=51028 RepID=A0A0N4VMF3_ENTVE|nr:unnamed protein product [Enterobius vermicularis]